MLGQMKWVNEIESEKKIWTCKCGILVLPYEKHYCLGVMNDRV